MSRDGLVFVVDDDVSVRRSLGVLIRSVGLESEVFASAQAFLDHPLPDRPCCLVLDLRLPGPSGLDLQLALLKRTRPIPIVFISGHGDVPITARAMKGGAIDFLSKRSTTRTCWMRCSARSRRIGRRVWRRRSARSSNVTSRR